MKWQDRPSVWLKYRAEDKRRITEAEWRARVAQFPGGEVPPHFTLAGEGPKYLTNADLVTVTDETPPSQ